MVDVLIENASLSVSQPTALGFAFTPLKYWESGEDYVLADSGYTGTRVTWRYQSRRFEFTINGEIVATLEAVLPGFNGTLFYNNGLFDIKGRVIEYPIQPWEYRPHNTPIEFDYASSAWCIATYPAGSTALWIYPSGNVRAAQVIETGEPVVRAFDLPYTGFEQLLHLTEDGVLSVTALTERLIVYAAHMGISSPSVSGYAYKIAPTESADLSINDILIQTSLSRLMSVEDADLDINDLLIDMEPMRVSPSDPVDLDIPGMEIDAGTDITRVMLASGDMLIDPLTIDSDVTRLLSATGDLDIDSYLEIVSQGTRIGTAEDSDLEISPVTMETEATRIGLVDGTQLDVVPLEAEGDSVRVGTATGDMDVFPNDIEISGDALRVGSVVAVINMPAPEAAGSGIRLAVFAVDIDVPSLEADGSGFRITHMIGDMDVNSIEIFTQILLERDEHYQLFRVVAISRPHMGSLQQISLEAIDKPIDL